MSAWEAIAGETPIDPSGLLHRGSVTNRRELAAVEALNINKAFLKYLASTPSARSARFDVPWFLTLHREMFGDVWTWAGLVRTHDVNIGVAHHQVVEQLKLLADDLHNWSGFGHPLETQAVWLHHKAVRIHPFENGNGRWGRLLSNVWLKLHGASIVFWPDQVLGVGSGLGDEYIAALRAADRGDDHGLTELHHRFQEGAC